MTPPSQPSHGSKEPVVWNVVERKLGPAGGVKERTARQRRWDDKYGADAWAVGYVADGIFVLQEQAYEDIYVASYDAYFDDHPADLDLLCTTARTLRNPHAEVTGGVDLQVPAVLEVVARRGRRLDGNDVVDIGSHGTRSHALSVRLSPSQVPCICLPSWSLEKFWQRKKCLAVWR